MSKSNLTKNDLKTLAKFMVEENKKYEEEESKKKIEKDKKNKKEKLKKILEDEDSKINFLESFIDDMLEDPDDFIDLEFINDTHKILFDTIEDLEDLINDMNKEYKKYIKKLKANIIFLKKIRSTK